MRVIGLSLLLMLPAVARATDIAVSGFNQDVIAEKGDASTAHRFDTFARNPASWIEIGVTTGRPGPLLTAAQMWTALVSSVPVPTPVLSMHCQVANGLSIDAAQVLDTVLASPSPGLPSSRQFKSATRSGVTYHLQPYDQNNCLRLGDDMPGSATLEVKPGTYAALHILAASGSDGTGFPPQLGQTSDIILNFADGSERLPDALLAYDWCYPYTGAPAAVVALGGLSRNMFEGPLRESRPSVIDPRHVFSLYETNLDLAALGFTGRTLKSITFNAVSSHSATGVFAVDGTETNASATAPTTGR